MANLSTGSRLTRQQAYTNNSALLISAIAFLWTIYKSHTQACQPYVLVKWGCGGPSRTCISWSCLSCQCWQIFHKYFQNLDWKFQKYFWVHPVTSELTLFINNFIFVRLHTYPFQPPRPTIPAHNWSTSPRGDQLRCFLGNGLHLP